MFQSTHAQSVRQRGVQVTTPQLLFQSTHAQSVRQCQPSHSSRSRRVSIHARAERATYHQYPDRLSLMFQSTHAQSVRQCQPSHSSRSRRVSIHARAERATYHQYPDRLSLMFQSTHAQSVRQFHAGLQSTIHGFNPRTRRACDHSFSVSCVLVSRFNPRTRRACDTIVNSPI